MSECAFVETKARDWADAKSRGERLPEHLLPDEKPDTDQPSSIIEKRDQA